LIEVGEILKNKFVRSGDMFRDHFLSGDVKTILGSSDGASFGIGNIEGSSPTYPPKRSTTRFAIFRELEW